MATFSVQKRTGRLCFGKQAPLYAACLEGLKEGQWYDLSITKKKHPKTTPQLNYWWGVVVPTAVEALKEATGGDFFNAPCAGFTVHVAITPETVHEFLKQLYAVHIGATKPIRVSKMTDDEMSDLIDFTCMWLAKNLGAIVPQPVEGTNVR